MNEIIFNRDQKAYRFEVLIKAGGKSATAESVLDVLFGCVQGYLDSDYVVTYRHNPYIKTTVIQRINLLWVWPLMAITAPVRFIATGDMGVSSSGRFGRFLHKLIGEQ